MSEKMNDEREILLKNMLTAEQLIQNKGIKCNTLKEWEQTRKILPKFGQKQFEPNNSWLEKVQIEKGVQNCKDLLNIERVERISQLASAEWLPEKKKAQVIKKSGQDWNNFGVEINNILYLIPEEALLLLEMNCLELLWNGLPLSIQQAYDILIDDIACTLEEYRVYSQLTRYGYHIQRFHYEDTIKDIVLDEPFCLKRKVIIEPEKGLRMGDCQLKSPSKVSNNVKGELSMQETSIDANINKSMQSSNDTIKNITQKVIEDIISTVESTNDTALLISKCYDKKKNEVVELENEITNLNNEQFKLDLHEKQVVKSTDDSQKKRNSSIEIISEEMVCTNIKVVSPKNSVPVPKWLDSRIQRNVKLLPRRTEKILTVNNKSECTNKFLEENTTHKRKEPLSYGNELGNKKSKMEVIELSDDEIQIVSQTISPLARMEMLDLLPNIASQAVIIQKISQDYIPHTIKPHRSVYQYETNRLQYLSEMDSKMRCKHSNRDLKEIPHSSTSHLQTDSKVMQRGCLIPFHNQNLSVYIYAILSRALYTMQLSQYSRFGSFQYSSNRYPRHTYGYKRGSGYIQKNLNSNNSRAFSFGYSGNFGSFGNTMHRNRLVDTGVRLTRNGSNEYQSSFKILPNVTSWRELKQKWHDERTITIDDEDCNNKENFESTEIEILKEHISPLVGPNNVANLAEVYDKLKIIKTASEKTVRRRKSKFKISYNIYSNTQHYRKGNPGEPLYRLVVIRQNQNPFFQPVELNRLQQEAKGTTIIFAIVSMSISYIRPGIVSIPFLS